jgi:ATP-dependent Clp protease ATP-binding subunit ClpA
MQLALSIQIVWPLAAEEAMAANFECIEPDHLCNALLKFAEVSSEELRVMAANPLLVETLVLQRDALRGKLQQVGIQVPEQSTQIRRMLRQRIGNGGYRGQRDHVIHRSQEARDVCTKAEEAARAASATEWTGEHLLAGLLQNPSRMLASVLMELGVGNVKPAAVTPWLDEHGQDLTALAAQGRLAKVADIGSVLSTDPVCKVVAQTILGQGNNNVLLIQTGKITAMEIVETLAQVFAGNQPPNGARGKRIIEIALLKLRGHEARTSDAEDVLREILQEAKRAGNVILWLSDLCDYIKHDARGNAATLVKDSIADPSVPCIACVSNKIYEKHFARDSKWKGVFQSVWIHDVVMRTQL